jgi:hypothetical protein
MSKLFIYIEVNTNPPTYMVHWAGNMAILGRFTGTLSEVKELVENGQFEENYNQRFDA